MDRFMYQIHPRRPITGLFPGRAVRKAMGLKLTKEEVLKCMTFGPVYRAFPSIPPVRVTGSTLDSLHVSEEDYLNKKDNSTNTSNTTEKAPDLPAAVGSVTEEPKIEPLTEEITEEKPVFHIDESEEKEENIEPIPVPLEPGPVILEPENDPEPVPVPVEPGPVIVEKEKVEESVNQTTTVQEIKEDASSIDTIIETESEDDEFIDDAEDEDDEVEQIPVGNVIQPQGYNPNRKRKKHKH